MTVADLYQDARVAHVRELKAENARLKADLQRISDDLQALKSHFALAVAVARDVAALPPEGEVVLLDGWNLVLGDRAGASRPSKDALIANARDYACAHAASFVWVVFDGPVASAEAADRFRLSYTGGTGAHRADRLLLDYIRMARLVGETRPITLVTADRDLMKEAARLGAVCKNPSQFPNDI